MDKGAGAEAAVILQLGIARISKAPAETLSLRSQPSAVFARTATWAASALKRAYLQSREKERAK